MKRMLLTLLPASLLALSAPAVASAHHGHRHSRHHHHHASSARLINFGAAMSLGTTAPAVQASPTTENAGTVESFENGVLKIKLGNGKVVEGKVTEQTELRCVSATPSTQGGDDDEGDDQQGDDQQPRSSAQFASQHGDSLAHAADGGGDQDDDDGQESCPATTALVKGATVREAELELTGAGGVWEQVIIAH
jgi:hypothetical protein